MENRIIAANALKERVVFVINTAGGSCTEKSADEARVILDKAGFAHADIISASGAEIESVLDRAAASADVLIVLGGDGTIRTAIEKYGPARGFLVLLPGGTMNMLSKALYGERTWQTVLNDTITAPDIHEVSGGRSGNHQFFVAALLGAPTLWADAREAVRAGDLVKATRRAVTAARRSLSEPLEYVFGDGARGSAEAVAVVCPLISKVMNEDERMLEAAAVDTATAAEALRLGFHALFDDWRDDPSVSRAKVKSIHITGHGRVPAIFDGETVRMGRSVAIDFVPVAFRALVPVGQEPSPIVVA